MWINVISDYGSISEKFISSWSWRFRGLSRTLFIQTSIKFLLNKSVDNKLLLTFCLHRGCILSVIYFFANLLPISQLSFVHVYLHRFGTGKWNVLVHPLKLQHNTLIINQAGWLYQNHLLSLLFRTQFSSKVKGWHAN